MRHSLVRRTAIVAAGATLLLATPATARNGGDRSDRITVEVTYDAPDAHIGDGECADAQGACTLRAAVQEANADPGRTTIELGRGVHVLSLPNAGGDEEQAATGDLDVTSEIEILGSKATLDVGGIDRAFDVATDARLQVRGLTVVNGRVAGTGDPVEGSGGAFANAGSLHLDGVRLEGNVAEGPGASGGAVLNTGRLLVESSVLTGNSATRAGGAIEANAGTTTVSRSTLSNNTTGPTPGNGGALHLTGAGVVEVDRSDIVGNIASAEGGGLWNSGSGTMRVTRSDIEDNRASGDEATNGGGGLFNDGGQLTVERSSIVGNLADGAAGSGGGILNDQGDLVVSRTSIRHNASNRAGGGIESNIGTTQIIQSRLLDNATGAAPGNGGAFHITGAGEATVDRSSIERNTAASEGGGLWNGSGTMVVTRSVLLDNVAGGDGADNGGGAMFNNGGVLQIDRSWALGNVADGASGSGGGILNDQGEVSIDTSLIVANRSSRAGGGVEANVGSTSIVSSVLGFNSTGAAPGNGGAVHLTGAGDVTIDRTKVLLNAADAEGGGVWNSATGTTTVTRSLVTANRAPDGPDLFNDGGTFTVDGTSVPNSNG